MAVDTTYQPKVFKREGGDELVVASGGTITLQSGGSLVAESGSTLNLPDIAIQAADIGLAIGSIIVGTTGAKGVALDAKTDKQILIGNGTTITSAAVTGDITIGNTGVTAIGAKKVANTMIAAAAGTVLVGTKTSGDVTALDISADGAMALGQGAGNTAAAYAMSGDVTMTKGGVTAIGATKVTSGMWANGAGVAALLTAGLGGSAVIVKTDTTTKTIVALNGSKARACLVVATVTEAFATGDTSRTLVTVGETDTPAAMWANTVFPNGLALGTVLVGAFTNTINKAITIDSVAAAGTGTGAVSITVLAIPTT